MRCTKLKKNAPGKCLLYPTPVHTLCLINSSELHLGGVSQEHKSRYFSAVSRVMCLLLAGGISTRPSSTSRSHDLCLRSVVLRSDEREVRWLFNGAVSVSEII
jgi:hypothetical protein